jgi:hypothetical protein
MANKAEYGPRAPIRYTGAQPTIRQATTGNPHYDGIGQGPTPIDSNKWYTDNLPGISPHSKSGWELDDDTAGFMTDVFNTLNSPEEGGEYGGGRSGGGGGGGGGPGFSGGPGGEYDVTWDFGRGKAFKPQGLI